MQTKMFPCFLFFFCLKMRTTRAHFQSLTQHSVRFMINSGLIFGRFFFQLTRQNKFFANPSYIVLYLSLSFHFFSPLVCLDFIGCVYFRSHVRNIVEKKINIKHSHRHSLMKAHTNITCMHTHFNESN